MADRTRGSLDAGAPAPRASRLYGAPSCTWTCHDGTCVDDCYDDCPRCEVDDDCYDRCGVVEYCTYDCVAGRCDFVGCFDPCEGLHDLDGDGYCGCWECAGRPDCDEKDPTLHGSGTRPCYSGPEGTDGVGSCTAGTEHCADGVWDGVCDGEVLPAVETCDGVDEDCNGVVDDAC